LTILIDIGHPAHVHYYRNLVRELENKGNKVIWTVKNLDTAKLLLDFYGFRYTVLPSKADRLPLKIFRQLLYDLILFNIYRKEKVNIAIGTSVTIAHISKISKIKSIVFDDDDDNIQPLVTKFANPFASTLLSPDALTGNRKRKDTIYYPGYHELAYLHPNRFKPDPLVLLNAGLNSSEPFFVMRFNVFKAHHDIGVKGLSLDQKLRMVEILKPHGKILITTERGIEPELKAYQLKISPEKVHSLMYYATMFLGDSQTMTSEAAILGTPAIKCNSYAGRLSVPNELENKYHICYSFLPQQFDLMLEKINELIYKQDLKKEWHIRRDRMLKDKIDVTSFWTWFVENYPQSTQILKENPEYLERFK
jgi:predicted glycosyltransferase